MPTNFLIPQTRINNLVANLQTLQDNIDAIQEDLDDLHQTITQEIGQAITDLQELIADEKTRATGVEGTLSNLTTDSKTNLVSAINEVDSHTDTNTTNLSNEITRATTAEGTLTTNLANEVSRATTAEGKKVDKVSTANRVYGTDGSGAQTTYDKNSFGKVDDVKVNGTSVVSNKVASLGSMAGETASDYATVTSLNNKIQKVTTLPSTQETGVLYCIPE